MRLALPGLFVVLVLASSPTSLAMASSVHESSFRELRVQESPVQSSGVRESGGRETGDREKGVRESKTAVSTVDTSITETSAALIAVAKAFRERRLTTARAHLVNAIARAHPSDLGPHGGPLHFWREILDLADCVPLTPELRQPHVPVNRWEVLIGLARLERMRLERSRFHRDVASGLRAALWDPSFFDRSPLETRPHAVRWPYSVELWDDELPVPMEDPWQCDEGRDHFRRPLSDLVNEELALASSLIAGMTPRDPGWAALHWLRASLLVARGDVNAALDASMELSGAGAPPLSEEERDIALLLEAMRRERKGELDSALELYPKLLESPWLVASRSFVQSRMHSALATQGRWEELLDRLPDTPRLDTETGRYAAWLRGRALSELDRVAELFDHARSVLRRAPRHAKDEALSLLAELVHVRLARAPFDGRVIELLESLGPPRDLYPRVERFARVAMDRGHHAQAKAALQWLLNHHEAAHVHPRYQALLGLVAFESENPSELRRWLQVLSVPPERLLRVIPAPRRAAFWRERDRELLALVSILVPRLPERAERAWATVVADALEPFLRDAPESAVHEPLTELYRTVRGLLAEDDRAWAERIGATSPPLILGEVVVQRPEPHPPLPRAPLRLDEPRVLVRLPLAADPGETTAWLSRIESADGIRIHGKEAIRAPAPGEVSP